MNNLNYFKNYLIIMIYLFAFIRVKFKVASLILYFEKQKPASLKDYLLRRYNMLNSCD